MQADIAALLVTTTAIFGAEAAVRAAIVEFDEDTVLDASRRLTKAALPKEIRASVSEPAAVMKAARDEAYRSENLLVRTVGGEVGHVIVHVLIGMVIGAMVSLREAAHSSPGGPLVVALAERARRLGDAFRNDCTWQFMTGNCS